MKSPQNVFSLPIILDGCRVAEKIGSSPLGDLYHVVHPRLGNCALKHLTLSHGQSGEFAEKCLPSLEKMIDLTHPNLATIYQVGKGEGAFVLRELVCGTSLKERLKVKPKFDLVEASQILWDMAMGLLAGYPLGIVYRNIKPTNVILLPNGRARLVDLCLLPTYPGYVSPEQLDHRGSSPASDIYALGIIYYQLLAGYLPTEREGEFWRDLSEKCVHPLIAKMVAPSLEDRYQSPFALIKDVREALQNAGVDVKSLTSGSTQPLPKMAPHAASGKPTQMIFVKEQETQLNTTRKMNYEEYAEKETETAVEGKLEEIYLSNRSLEENPDKALARITHIEDPGERKGNLPARLVHFPKGFEEKVVGHLQQAFRRETWLLKESEIPGQMEVEIDMEQSYILCHFYRYEDQLQGALEKLRRAPGPDAGALPVNHLQTGPGDSTQIKDTGHGETGNLQTVQYSDDEISALKEQSQEDVPESYGTTGTISVDQEQVIHITDTSNNLVQDCYIDTINDITISGPKMSAGGGESQELAGTELEIVVDFRSAYQTMGWTKFVHEHNLKRGEHFELKDASGADPIRRFGLRLEKLEKYQKEQENIARIKEFFQGDYEIRELDRGGMGMVLKLTAKNDPTILSLRPENLWARQRFAPYLRVVKDSKGKEIIYAEIPKGTEFVVKVAFDGHEDSLVQEARILSKVAEDPHVCQTIIGSVQQGRLFTMNDKADQTQIGYYLMLEYAAQGDTERLYHRFPDGKLPPTIAFALMYGMVQTLQKLKKFGIIHRDIKPHNILLDNNGLPKLSDFGLAITTTQESDKLTEERKRLLRIMDEGFLHVSRTHEQARERLMVLEKQIAFLDESSEKYRSLQQDTAALKREIESLRKQEEETAENLKDKYRLISAQENALQGKFAGSLFYAAPEQLDPEAVLTPKCDIYQLGAVMFTLLTGKRPVEGATSLEIMSRILYPVKPEVSDHVKGNPLVDALSKLILKMMLQNQEQRIDIDEAREELDRILFEHTLELRTLPAYPTPAGLETESEMEKRKHRIALAEELHSKCVNLIFSTIFHNQPLPSLGKELEKIVFSCPHCGKKLHLYRHMDGKRGVCPKCRKGMLVKLS